VGVGVDETGQNGCVFEIDDLRAGWQRMRARRTDVDYAITANDDVLVAPGLGAGAVNERLGSNDEGLIRSLSEADI
jgi:hypothetical protein